MKILKLGGKKEETVQIPVLTFVQRKLIFCGFQLGDSGQVKRAWMLLPEQERDPQTTYLVYQILLKDSDSGLGNFFNNEMCQQLLTT